MAGLDGLEALRKRIDTLENRLASAEDRCAIHRLFVDLQTAMDERDLVKYGNFYAEDGEWCAVNGRAIGPAAITELLSRYCKPWESEARRSYHSISDITIDVQGDVASAHGQWRHIHPDEEGGPVSVHFGHFDATLRRTAEGWRLTRRASYLDLPYVEPKYQLIGLHGGEMRT